jgi:hypothetical protein
MTKQEMLWIATKYHDKGYSIEAMYYSDECYYLGGEEGDKIKDEIAEYMVEINEIGTTAFYEKYKDFKLY